MKPTAEQVAPEVVGWAREFRHILQEDHPELDSLSLTMGAWALHVTKGSARVASPDGLIDLTPRLEEQDQIVWVGCTCNGGKAPGGPFGHPAECRRCGGSGVVPAPVPPSRTSDSLRGGQEGA